MCNYRCITKEEIKEQIPLKTQDEMVEFVKNMDDWHSAFTCSDIIIYLDFEHAKQFLKEDAIKRIEAGESQWELQIPTREEVINRMKDYFAFAMEKADNQRGLSAGRSIMHYQNWLWLLNDTEIDTDHYDDYGISILMEIKNKYFKDG